MGGKGHLFERLHGKDPYSQIKYIEEYGLGNSQYQLEMIK
jgi:uncharacterized Fe-S center protein